MDQNKTLSHITWLFEANSAQFRYILNDIKRAFTFNNFQKSQLFNKYAKNLETASVLLKQGERAFTSNLKNGTLSQQTMTRIHNLYIKRSYYQSRLALEYLSQIVYDTDLNSDPTYKNIYSKTYNLTRLLSELDQNFAYYINSY